MPRLELFPIRYRDPVTGKWVRARYRAELHEIEARYVEWEITGLAEIRDVDTNARAFDPPRQIIGDLGPILAIVEWRWRDPRRVAIAGIAS